MGTLAKTFAICIIIELGLIFQYLILAGALADNPLPAVIAICESAGTNPYDLGLAIFIIGTLVNAAFVMPVMIITSRRGVWE